MFHVISHLHSMMKQRFNKICMYMHTSARTQVVRYAEVRRQPWVSVPASQLKKKSFSQLLLSAAHAG